MFHLPVSHRQMKLLLFFAPSAPLRLILGLADVAVEDVAGESKDW